MYLWCVYVQLVLVSLITMELEAVQGDEALEQERKHFMDTGYTETIRKCRILYINYITVKLGKK